MEFVISPYERIGEENIKKLIHYFYQELRNDSILRPMYKEDLIEAEERLYLFMIQFLGGPQNYNKKRGLPKLRQRHMQFAIDENAKNNWLNNMKTALDKTDINDADKKYLWDYFVKTANFLKNK